MKFEELKKKDLPDEVIEVISAPLRQIKDFTLQEKQKKIMSVTLPWVAVTRK